MRTLLALLCLTFAAHAEGERAGDFDYYVMALSWSPNWCEREGDAKGSPQCDAKYDFGFTLHGLWPQYNRGYPSYCQTVERPPSRAQTAAMADIMGTGGLAWHQWKKHGSCTGLSASAYYQLSRDAYARINRPQIFRKLTKPIRLPAKIVEEAFLEANPDLRPNQITITCKKNQIQEARICLTKSLEFVDCGPDVRRDCTSTVGMAPVR